MSDTPNKMSDEELNAIYDAIPEDDPNEPDDTMSLPLLPDLPSAPDDVLAVIIGPETKRPEDE